MSAVLRRGGTARTIGKLGEEDAVRDALEDDTTTAIVLVHAGLPGEAVDDDEASRQSYKNTEHAFVRAPHGERTENEQDRRRPNGDCICDFEDPDLPVAWDDLCSLAVDDERHDVQADSDLKHY